MSRQSLKSKEREEALAQLREWIKPGDTVYTILRHVSRSGMQRHISLVIFPGGAAPPLHPNYSAGKVLGRRVVNSHGRDALTIGGVGMDMGFALVYELGRALFPDGAGDENNGGYCIRHEWI